VLDDRKFEEKRHFPRFETDIFWVKFRPLIVPPPAEAPAYTDGQVVDISFGGMRFTTKQSLAVGQRIQYWADSPSGKSGREGVARVVRIDETPKGFLVAVEFINP